MLSPLLLAREAAPSVQDSVAAAAAAEAVPATYYYSWQM